MPVPLCDICKQPLSDTHIRLKVTAHMSCIVKECYGDEVKK